MTPSYFRHNEEEIMIPGIVVSSFIIYFGIGIYLADRVENNKKVNRWISVFFIPGLFVGTIVVRWYKKLTGGR